MSTFVYASRWPRAIESPADLHEKRGKGLFRCGLGAFDHSATDSRPLLGAPRSPPTTMFPSLFPDGQLGTPMSQCPQQVTEAMINRLYHFSFPGWDSASGLPWPLHPLPLNTAWDMGSPPRMSPTFAMPPWASRNVLLSPSSEPRLSRVWLEHQAQVAGLLHGAQEPHYLYGQINLANATHACVFISTLA